MVHSFWCGGNAGSATQDLSLKDEIADMDAIVKVCREQLCNDIAWHLLVLMNAAEGM